MLRLLFFLSSLSLQVSAAIQNISINLTDSSLSFAPGWELSESQSSGGLFSFTDTNGPVLTVSLPNFASSLSYVGLKRTGGSLYGVCVDCNGTLSTAFSGHDDHLVNNALAVPTTIFTLTLDPSRQHVLGITNIPDPSFNDASELTFIEIIVSVEDATSSTLTTSSSSTLLSSTLLPTSSTFLPSSISSSSSTSSTASSSADNDFATTKSLIAVVVVLPLFAVLSLVLGLFFYLRNRGRRKGSPWSGSTSGERPSSELPTMSRRIPSPELGPLAAAGRERPPARQPDPFVDGLDTPLDGSIAIYPVRRPLSRIVV